MAKEVAQESVTLETLIEHYDMSLSDIARKVDADERFVHEATRYLLETPDDISHESEKKEFNDISAEQNVKKWRNEGTLIGRIFNFSKEEKDKYSPFIELNEFYDTLLQFWTIKRIVSLKIKQRTKESVQEELAKLTSCSAQSELGLFYKS